ncbi:hypothetical protein DL96DRAFT_397766 [Flagelloscypha sp. PMI_526]|nr:hypothetical protein DL96DRAFT_397766 [Flagelloscypha sp. PMI_526]
MLLGVQAIFSPVLLSAVIVASIHILSQEAVLWTVAASNGTLEEYRRKRRQRWSMGGVGCGTGRMNAEIKAKKIAEKRAAAAETYRREHGMSAKQ